MDLLNSFGTLASVCFILGPLFQAIEVYQKGHAKDVSTGLLWSWLIGIISMIIYTFFKLNADVILLINYSLQLILVLFILRYKYI